MSQGAVGSYSLGVKFVLGGYGVLVALTALLCVGGLARELMQLSERGYFDADAAAVPAVAAPPCTSPSAGRSVGAPEAAAAPIPSAVPTAAAASAPAGAPTSGSEAPPAGSELARWTAVLSAAGYAVSTMNTPHEEQLGSMTAARGGHTYEIGGYDFALAESGPGHAVRVGDARAVLVWALGGADGDMTSEAERVASAVLAAAPSTPGALTGAVRHAGYRVTEPPDPLDTEEDALASPIYLGLGAEHGDVSVSVMVFDWSAIPGRRVGGHVSRDGTRVLYVSPWRWSGADAAGAGEIGALLGGAP